MFSRWKKSCFFHAHINGTEKGLDDSLTISPAVQLILQPRDGVPQGLVLLLLSLILLLPLLCCQLNVHCHCVLDGLCSGL